MDFNSNKQAISSSEVNNSYLHNENESKLITASADFIPAFFSPNGVLKKENENNKPNILEILIQSEDFFKEHPNSFQKDELKSSFVINKFTGTARKWGFSLLTDGTLMNLKYSKFKKLLLDNFDIGNERKQKYFIIEKM